MKQSTIDALTARQTGLNGDFNRKTLEQWQLNQIRKTLSLAITCPVYKEFFSRIQPERIRTFADFARLPLFKAEDLFRNSHLLECTSQSAISRIITLKSSGSTGSPKRIAFTTDELQSTYNFFQEGMENLLTEGENVLVLLPASRPDSVGDLLLRSLPEKGHPTFSHWPPGTPAQLKAAVQQTNANCVIGLPQHLLSMAETLEEGHHVRTMLLNSDYAPVTLRRRIEACGITTFLHYGTTESGFGGGVECDAHNGCHLREGELFIEIIDPESGMPCEEGEIGEIVLTTLNRRAMPFIRYRTGDFGSLTKKQCRCSAVTARLLNIHRFQGCDTQKGFLTSHELDDLFYEIPGLWDYRASLCEDGLSLQYLAKEKIASTDFPRLPCDLHYRTIFRIRDFQRRHTGKRTILDCRGRTFEKAV